MSNESLDELLRRIQSEYLEMPGLQLTPFQAQRLWALDRETCATILEVLIDRQFLIRGPDDRYRRVSDGNSLKQTWRGGRPHRHDAGRASSPTDGEISAARETFRKSNPAWWNVRLSVSH